jgi:DNA-binding response OmpR family regulator
MRALIIEDQENLAKLIKTGLESEGFAADCVYDGTGGQTRMELYHDDYDLVILDLMLPDKDGISVCQTVREKNISTPILILTARDGETDIIAGLNAGADDYLVKPFSFKVLLARIQALLRRPKQALPSILKTNEITLNPLTKKVFVRDREARLTLKEFGLLEYLMRHPNQVMNREQIISNLWDFAYDSFSNIVDVHITNLRRKIGDRDGRILQTVYGVGYKINGS